MLPANTLRFYIHFPRPAEAHFERDQLCLLDDKEQVVRDPFLVLSQELWSPDGRRLTVLMEPGRIKRGLGADPTHEPALVVGRTYSLSHHGARADSAPYLPRRRSSSEGGRRDPVASRLSNSGEPRSRGRALRQGYGCRPLRGRDRSSDRFRRGHSDECVSSHRTEPQRRLSRAILGAPGSTTSLSLNASKTFAATGWVRLWIMT